MNWRCNRGRLSNYETECKALDLDTSSTESMVIGFTISEKGRVSSVQETNGDIPVLTYSVG